MLTVRNYGWRWFKIFFDAYDGTTISPAIYMLELCKQLKVG